MTHTPLTKAEREELRRLHDAATMGPWHRDPLYWSLRIVEKGGSDVADGLPDDTRWPRRDDAGYICASHDALPRLLADLDAAEAKVRTQFQTTFDELRKALGSDIGSEGGLCAIITGIEDIRAQRDRAESELDAERRMRVEAEAAAKRAESERDALKAKLADPRRVLIHETEVVATKEEIATLKARLADLSDADEELHTCRALVNATSENLSVDLERMVDDLAEANEKAALSGKDSHSWHELYKDTKAKLAACEAERDAQATELVDERDRAKAKLAAAESAHSELFLSGQVAELRGKLAAVVAAYDHVFGDFDHSALSVDARILFDAIAAARGGASRG